MAMFTVYLDDSGTSPNQPIAVASAILMPAQRIVAFEREWRTFLTREGLTSFHMAEFVARNPKSEYSDYDDAKRERVLNRVLQISTKYGTRAFSFAAHKRDYDEVVVDEWRDHFGKDHYAWAVRHVLDFVDKWRLSRVPIPLEYVFDWMGKRSDPRRREVELVMEQAEGIANEFGRTGEYTHYSFRHREEIAGLQCVDALAWVYFQVALRDFNRKPMHPFAIHAATEYERIPKWIRATTANRAMLTKWFEGEKKNPRSLHLLREWQERKARRKANRARLGP